MIELKNKINVMSQPNFLFLVYARIKNGVIKNNWKSTAKYHPYDNLIIYPTKAIIHAIWSMIFEVVDKEHIP